MEITRSDYFSVAADLTFSEALDLLRWEGVEFDRAYILRFAIPRAGRADPNAKHLPVQYGTHTYINRGDGLNVAWFTPDYGRLYWLHTPRLDETRMDVRHPVTIDDKEDE